MALIEITIDREALPVHTQEQFEEWVRFSIGEYGGIRSDNPLHDLDLEGELHAVGG